MEGNYYARRKFALMKNLFEHIGLEPGRLHFSWISSAEATKFAEVANEVSKVIEDLGPARYFIKRKAEVE
ncbi:MAG: hydrogenase iron-sulfur subunit [Deltaproteobacteria bacterium]|nr:hydrogenase iron-sulfur subunit [Deltaproteobacteria bacterium]